LRREAESLWRGKRATRTKGRRGEVRGKKLISSKSSQGEKNQEVIATLAGGGSKVQPVHKGDQIEEGIGKKVG